MSDSEIEQQTKKRPIQDGEEIEIDLNQSAPLSKKQKRLLRKGKLDVSKLEEQQKQEVDEIKNPKPKSKSADGDDDEASGDQKKDKRPPKFGVWIGNLSFDTSKDDLIRFITNKTVDKEEYSEELGEDEPAQINEQDIIRVNLPTDGKDSKKIKGFAYIDLKTKNHQLAVIQLSEQNLNGRNLLIKNSESFEGRPSKEEAQLSKNPPSRILFVGNLSFDTTDDLLTQHFQHCGQILKIRLATFQDTGKCKGFAFIDFKDEEGPTNALKDKSVKRLLNRQLRMEFGEDRSKRTPKIHQTPRDQEDQPTERSFEKPAHSEPVSRPIRERPSEDRPIREKSDAPKEQRKPKKSFQRSDKPQARPKSSVTLASAQRGSAAIVKSTGKKVTF